MTTMLRTILTAAALAGAVAAPAFAACNPGSPNCIRVAPGSRLAQLKAKLTHPGTLGSGEQQCKNSSLCGIDTGDGTSPGYWPR